MEISLNEIVRDTMIAILEYEKTGILTYADVKKIVKKIIDREDFNDIIIEEIKEYTKNM